jgi:hypothetical protein
LQNPLVAVTGQRPFAADRELNVSHVLSIKKPAKQGGRDVKEIRV